MRLSVNHSKIFRTWFFFLFMVHFGLLVVNATTNDPKENVLINLNQIENRLDEIEMRLIGGRKKVDKLQEKLVKKHLSEDSLSQEEEIVLITEAGKTPPPDPIGVEEDPLALEEEAASTGPENPTNQKVEVVTDKKAEPIPPNDKPGQSLPKKYLPPYYFSFSTNRHFASDSKMQTLSGMANLENKAGYGLSMELGRSFGTFELGLATGFDHMSLEQMKVGSNSIAGKGESSVFHMIAKPGLALELSERFLLRTALGLGFASRQSDYEVASIGFKESGQNISMIWGLYLTGYYTLKNNAQLFGGYRLFRNPGADEFGDFTSHAIEAGFRFNY